MAQQSANSRCSPQNPETFGADFQNVLGKNGKSATAPPKRTATISSVKAPKRDLLV